MKAYQEITDWKDNIANGVYFMDDSKSKMYAYVRPGDSVAKEFKHPIRIDTRGRKFKVVSNTFGYVPPTEAVVSANPTWTVAGSKGDKYIVEKVGTVYNCTCSGFKFRGACRHITEVETNA